MSSPVNLTITNGIAIITLDDGKANALGFAMQAVLGQAFDKAAADAEVDVIVFTGRPGVMSAGFDLKVMKEEPDRVNDMVTGGGVLLVQIFSCPKPTLIASPGHGIAAGGLLMLTADYRIGATGKAFYGLNETRIGMVLPPYGMDLARFKLSPRYLDAAVVGAELYAPEAAVEIGYLDEVVSAEKLMEAAMEKAKYLQGLDSKSYAVSKKIIRGTIAQKMADEL